MLEVLVKKPGQEQYRAFLESSGPKPDSIPAEKDFLQDLVCNFPAVWNSFDATIQGTNVKLLVLLLSLSNFSRNTARLKELLKMLSPQPFMPNTPPAALSSYSTTVDSAIKQITDIFPAMEQQLAQKYLAMYDGNPERVISSVLEGSLPLNGEPETQNIKCE